MEASIMRGFLSHIDMLNERVERKITVEQQRKEKRELLAQKEKPNS
jgi:hypothetical protein